MDDTGVCRTDGQTFLDSSEPPQDCTVHLTAVRKRAVVNALFTEDDTSRFAYRRAAVGINVARCEQLYIRVSSM